MKYTIQHRRGTTEQWVTANPVLAFGEVGVENTGTRLRSKIGDGVAVWASLPYADDSALAAALDAKSVAIAHADSGDSATLSTAKSYSDNGDMATLAGAKSYTDTKTTGLAGLLIDTGWRNITVDITGVAVKSGRLLIRRRRDEILLQFDDFVPTGQADNIVLPRLPVGFRPRFRARAQWFYSTGYTAGATFSVTTGGYFNLYLVKPGDSVAGRLVADTAEAFPTTLPGTPA